MYGHIYNIIVAAGNGSRFGAELPKQYCLFCGRPLIMTTIERFRDALPGSHVILVINESHAEMWESLCREYSFTTPATVFGGASRWESVKNAISTIPAPITDDTIITVHDGARPMASAELIRRTIAPVAAGAPGAIPVTPVTESLRMVTPTGSTPVDRANYRSVQTPQAFNGRLLHEAYKIPYRNEFTDDASVMAAAGHTEMQLVEGDPQNIKVTLPADIKIAELFNSMR